MAKRASRQPRGGRSGQNGRWERQQAAEALRGYGRSGGGKRRQGTTEPAIRPRERQAEVPPAPARQATKPHAKRPKPASKTVLAKVAPIEPAQPLCLLPARYPLPMVVVRERIEPRGTEPGLAEPALAEPGRAAHEMPVIVLPDLSEPLVVGVIDTAANPSKTEVVVREAFEVSLVLSPAAPTVESMPMVPIERGRALTAPAKGLRAAIGDWLRSAGRLLRAGLVTRRPDPLPKARQRLPTCPSGPAASRHPDDAARDGR